MTQAEITHEMWSLYQSGVSMPEIGRRYGCTKGAVSHRFKRAGLTARVIEADPALVAAALERHDSGESIASIARDVGRHPSNVRRWLRQRDVDTANQASIHRLTDVDTETRTAVCAVCGPVAITATTPGNIACAVKKNELRRPYLKHRQNRCNRCPFTHPDVRVFDVHHRNHDHDDNREENLETLCPTCHRLEHLGLAAVAAV